MLRAPLQYAIVITGGIATGKSAVSTYLKNQGFAVIDADRIAHQLLPENASKIADLFGQRYATSRQVNRSLLAELVFHNPSKRQQLESLLHPQIYHHIYRQCLALERRKQWYFVDIPLYFEGGQALQVQAVVVVYCSNQTALERLMKRNQLSLQEAQQRLDAQWSIEDKRKQSNYVIDNSADRHQLPKRVELFLAWLNSQSR